MFVISKLWIDVMENRDAYGYEVIGVVEEQEEADRICDLKHIPKSDYPWPLNHVGGDKKTVPLFKAQEISDLTGMELEELIVLGKFQ